MRARGSRGRVWPRARGAQRADPVPGRGLRAAAGVALVLLLAPAARPASALTMDEISPLFFEGVGGQGFSLEAVAALGRTASFTATPEDLWIAAPTPAIRIDQQIDAIHSNPENPSPEDPAIVDSLWTIENVAAGHLTAPLFVFTTLDPEHSYPWEPAVGLDSGILELLSYSFADTDYVYGAVQLPDLDEGWSYRVRVRYVVEGQLLEQDGSQLLAPLGVVLLGSYTAVPEPSTLALCALGLLASLSVESLLHRGPRRPGPEPGADRTP